MFDNDKSILILVIIVGIGAVVFGFFYFGNQTSLPTFEKTPTQSEPDESSGLEFSDQAQTFRVSSGGGNFSFKEIKMDPLEVSPAGTQKIQLKLNSPNPIEKIEAEAKCGEKTQEFTFFKKERIDHPPQETWQALFELDSKLPSGSCKTVLKATDQEGNQEQITSFWKIKEQQSGFFQFLSKKVFNLNEVYAASDSCHFPQKGDCKMDSAIQISEPVSGIEKGDLDLESYTLWLDEGVTFVWNPGYSIYPNPSEYIVLGDNARLKKGYLCVKDADNDGCWTDIQYSDSSTCSGDYRRLGNIGDTHPDGTNLPHRGDCDDAYGEYCTNCPGDECDVDSECPDDTSCDYESQCDNECAYTTYYCDSPDSKYSTCEGQQETKATTTEGDRCWTGDYGSCQYDSTCDETGLKYRDYKTCSGGTCSDTHTESKVDDCFRNTDNNTECGSDSCSKTYNDDCSGETLVEYDNDCKKDSTTVSDSCTKTCSNGTCEDCSVDCSAPDTTSHKCDGVCGYVECESHDYRECDNGDYYWYDSCGTREGVADYCSYCCSDYSGCYGGCDPGDTTSCSDTCYYRYCSGGNCRRSSNTDYGSRTCGSNCYWGSCDAYASCPSNECYYDSDCEVSYNLPDCPFNSSAEGIWVGVSDISWDQTTRLCDSTCNCCFNKCCYESDDKMRAHLNEDNTWYSSDDGTYGGGIYDDTTCSWCSLDYHYAAKLTEHYDNDLGFTAGAGSGKWTELCKIGVDETFRECPFGGTAGDVYVTESEAYRNDVGPYINRGDRSNWCRIGSNVSCSRSLGDGHYVWSRDNYETRFSDGSSYSQDHGVFCVVK